MKLINKTLALVLACSSVGLAQAGKFQWGTSNNTHSFHTYELDAAISQGIDNSDFNLPDLPKPWVLQFTIGGTTSNDYKAEPGLILIEKARSTPAGLKEVACTRMWFGTYTKTTFLVELRKAAEFVAGYVTTNPDCFVNDPAPAKKSSKK